MLEVKFVDKSRVANKTVEVGQVRTDGSHYVLIIKNNKYELDVVLLKDTSGGIDEGLFGTTFDWSEDYGFKYTSDRIVKAYPYVVNAKLEIEKF